MHIQFIFILYNKFTSISSSLQLSLSLRFVHQISTQIFNFLEFYFSNLKSCTWEVMAFDPIWLCLFTSRISEYLSQ
jgi:hypothetical protein